MKLASSSSKYLESVGWIAYEDGADSRDVEAVSGMLTVALVAFLFRVSTEAVATDVVNVCIWNDIR